MKLLKCDIFLSLSIATESNQRRLSQVFLTIAVTPDYKVLRLIKAPWAGRDKRGGAEV
jgi:hypothetical protein